MIHKNILIRWLFGSWLLLANSAWAKTVSLEPAHVRLSLSAGEVKSGALKIDNPSGDEVKIRVYLEDWRYSSSSDGAKEFFPAASTALSCAKWISFSPAEFTIPAFGRQMVNYTVRLPPEAKGGHFAVMFFETDLADNTESNQGSAVKLKARLGALFSVEVKDTLIYEVGLDNLKIKNKDGILKIFANFKNKGNTDIAPKIIFHIIDAQGKVFSRGKFSDIFTLPQDEGEISAEAKEDLEAGDYILVITMNLGKGLPQVIEAPIKVSESQINLAGNT
jgi:hypothetical protein